MNVDASQRILMALGLAGSMSTAGQWKLIRWLIEQRYIDVPVSTGANISEDILDAMGRSYYQTRPCTNDQALPAAVLNRYYDVMGKETDYRAMEAMLLDYLLTLPQGALFAAVPSSP